jgi:hypothetical protein
MKFGRIVDVVAASAFAFLVAFAKGAGPTSLSAIS